ncbi:MAG: helix-turn-helix domain-containing protein [Streptococcaceae bacterium]|jgi:transcriptional regulator with XRE-family HTH domain|nr:helix-turn-helix domain-containing protein [Streptococcaceae bacterium]
MTVFEKIKFLADKRKVSLQKVALDLGFSENYIYGLKRKKSPSAEHLAMIANYFHTSVDYLLGREAQPYTEGDLEVMASHAMAFGGKPLTEKDREFLMNFLQIYFDSKEEEPHES